MLVAIDVVGLHLLVWAQDRCVCLLVGWHCMLYTAYLWAQGMLARSFALTQIPSHVRLVLALCEHMFVYSARYRAPHFAVPPQIATSPSCTHTGVRMYEHPYIRTKSNHHLHPHPDHRLQATCTASVRNLWVHVLSSRPVRKPVRYANKPACAIMMPLSMQNLSGAGGSTVSRTAR